jgi:CubicO group peptidase (beta-lactamase class C family)
MKKIWKWAKGIMAGVLIIMFLSGSFVSFPNDFVQWQLARPLFAVLSPPVASATANIADVEQIDAFVSEQINRHGLPGVALALVEGDQIIFMKGYGMADQSGRPVTPQTPFLLASVSKPLTATAIMQLVEEGQVELDVPVQHYVPDFRLADPAASSQITVRHLLLHTSGIPTTACDTRVNAETLADYVVELQNVEPASTAGSRHNYCSGNYNLLGRVIETVSGQAFGEYMQTHIFTPLQMEHSFTSEQDALQAGMAQGYQWLFGIVVPTHHHYNPSQLPSGSMISSAEDLSHFLVSQLNEGNYEGLSFLSKTSVASMQTPGIERSQEGGYGFGWVVAPVGDVPAIWHDGVNANYHSLLLMQPETRRGVVVLMNSFGIVAYESAYQELEAGIVRLLAGQEPIESSQSLGTVYFMIDAVLILILTLVFIPFLRMLKWKAWLWERQKAGNLPRLRVLLRSAWEIGFGLGFLIIIRTVIVTGLGAQSWYEFFTVFPDFVLWIWAVALVVLSTGMIRLKLILRSRHSGMGNHGLTMDKSPRKG